ncbi:hypothetical protein FA95DRAFT_1565136 [Auriscalpium vulgare]|uniref:Uncharacterized protein n=1 Tax=Auriscalpium vulgare TaxID=40419 RepID=A0ACB8RC50_9AGAM|nr:hypothetical protein FA95DRAFT_1565136 [Auriscalpium vulgare]
MTIVLRLPPEVHSEIANWIDSPDDIWAFALTCRSLSKVAHPVHTHARLLRCPLEALYIWEVLARDAALAHNVRALDIRSPPNVLDSPYNLPYLFRRYDLADSQDSLALQPDRTVPRYLERTTAAAIKNLKNLVAVTWSSRARRFNATETETDMEDLWMVLASSCPNLTRLHVKEYFPRFIWSQSNIFNLSNLTFVEYETDIFGLEPGTAACEAFGGMLRERCPGLKTLIIRFVFVAFSGDPPPLIGQSILSGRWADLEHVKLENVACYPPDAETFLAAHPNIRHLDIDAWFGCPPLPIISEAVDNICELPLTLPPGALPKLETLVCQTGHAADILSLFRESKPRGPKTSILLNIPRFWHPRLAELLQSGILDGLEGVSLVNVDNARLFVSDMAPRIRRARVVRVLRKTRDFHSGK